jgi:hypothetical protein
MATGQPSSPLEAIREKPHLVLVLMVLLPLMYYLGEKMRKVEADRQLREKQIRSQ